MCDERSDIVQRITAIVEKYLPRRNRGGPVCAETQFDTLGIDSASRVDILLDIEDEFRISVDEWRFGQVRNIEELAALVADSAISQTGVA
jgi:acyl carrier protein